jgi:hypothetical protein
VQRRHRLVQLHVRAQPPRVRGLHSLTSELNLRKVRKHRSR